MKDDHLYVGGVDMVELAREQGTALYVMDEADMRTRMETYLAAFRSRYQNSDVVYASKAFLNKEAARIVADEGLCLDVSGGGELAIALAAGFPTERIFMHGNNKTPRELREAIQAGVGRIIIDSRIELKRISEIAGELGVVQPIYMRITPGVEADTHQYIRTGCEDSKFGFTMRDDFAYGCVKDVLAAPNVRLAGLHCHIGSQIFALHSYPEAVEVMVELMARIEEGYGYRIEELDVGGGLGIAYTADDKPASIDEFAETVTSAVHAACEKFGVPEPRLLTEPGRSLVANAGVTLYTVGILKTLPGIRKYVAWTAACPTTSARRCTTPITSRSSRTRRVSRAPRSSPSRASTAKAATPWSSTCRCSTPTWATSSPSSARARTATLWPATTTASRGRPSCS